MNIVENKYHSTVKVEFRDLVDHIINSNRKRFHMYTIHRLLSLGLLIDFPFKYIKTKNACSIAIELDLKESGKAVFIVDPESDYGSIADERSKKVLKHFLQNFDVTCEPIKKKRRFFHK